MMRQNRAEYFAEKRHWLFKAMSCGVVEWVVDYTNLCANGQRIRSNAALPCPLPVDSGGGNPPLAPGISPAGQPNPMQLADQDDLDPATTPQEVVKPNPDPGVAPGTPV